MSLNFVGNPYSYYNNRNKTGPLFNGFIYVGKPDLDPTIVANQKTVTAKQEDGTQVPIAQPIRTNSGGYAVDSGGNLVVLLVDGNYSIRVNDNQGNLALEQSDVNEGVPLTVDELNSILINYSRVSFNTAEEAKSGTLPSGDIVDLAIGEYVETGGRLSVNDGGASKYLVVANATGVDDGGLYIDLDNGNQLELIVENGAVFVEQFGAASYDVDFTVWPSAGMGYVDSTIPINAAYATGLTVKHNSPFPHATYRCTGELLVNTEGQNIYGNGAGELQLNFFARKQGTSWKTRYLFHGTPVKYTKTRRLPRLSASDPADAPTAEAVNIQGAYVHMQGILIDLEVDYDDLSPTNLGADYSNGIMAGTRVGVHLIDMHVRGYFRSAAVYLDNTRLGTEYPFSTPTGIIYTNDTGVNNGTDKFRAENLITAGGHKGLFIAGPIDGDNANYYDEIAGMLIPDSRGGFGTSDYWITQCFLGGPDHHSGWRRWNPPLNDAMDRIDPTKVVIDDAAGSYFYDSRPGANTSRRVKFDTCRFTTIEAVRIFIGNGREMVFNNPVTESLSGDVFDTSGNPVDQFDYTLGSFKDIACYPTDYEGVGTGVRRVSFLDSGGTPNTNYFQSIVPEHYLSIVGLDPSPVVTEDFDATLLFIPDPTTEDITITATEIETGVGFIVQVIAEWTGIDTTDVSAFTIAASAGVNMRIGDNGVLRVDPALSTALTFTDEGTGPYNLADVYELRVDGQSSGSTRFWLYKNGVRQRYADGNIAASGRVVASGVTSDTGI